MANILGIISSKFFGKFKNSFGLFRRKQIEQTDRYLTVSKRMMCFQPYREPYSRVPLELRKWQEKFQVDDGKPVWLKKGPSDRMLYIGTMALTGLGFSYALFCMFMMMYPPLAPCEEPVVEEEQPVEEDPCKEEPPPPPEEPKKEEECIK